MGSGFRAYDLGFRVISSGLGRVVEGSKKGLEAHVRVVIKRIPREFSRDCIRVQHLFRGALRGVLEGLGRSGALGGGLG